MAFPDISEMYLQDRYCIHGKFTCELVQIAVNGRECCVFWTKFTQYEDRQQSCYCWECLVGYLNWVIHPTIFEQLSKLRKTSLSQIDKVKRIS